MTAPLTEEDQHRLALERTRTDSTIDNGATTTQLGFLARVHQHQQTRREDLRQAFLRGVDFLLAAQYPNGGWPQFWPEPRGYAAHITFNDNAMVNVLTLLEEIASERSGFDFVDSGRRAQAKQAVARGVECILRCQVIVEGKPTVWCAQHDEKTFAPAGARTYEHASLSGSESAGIVRFLIGLEHPDARVVQAIESAAAWFERVKLTGIRVIEQPDPALPKGYDKVVVEDPATKPLWARFYEIRTNRPIFSGRDGIIRSRLAEIEYERRVGYAWYTDAPAKLLTEDVPAWRKRMRDRPNAAGVTPVRGQ